MVGVMREGIRGWKTGMCSEAAFQVWFLYCWSLRNVLSYSTGETTLCMQPAVFTLSFTQTDILHESKVTDILFDVY